MEYKTTYDLTATVLPADATNTSLRWSSSNPSVVYVKDGQLRAAKPGNATITCAAADGSNVKKSVKVQVKYYTKSKKGLSDGYPIGGPYQMKYSVQNEMRSGKKVEVHYLTVEKLNNNFLRFTFSYNAPSGYGISAFSPPNGEFYMVLPKGSTSSGEDVIQFEIHEDDFLASEYFTMKFYGQYDWSWVFPTIDNSLKEYLKNPSSIPVVDSRPSNNSKSGSGSSQSNSNVTSILTNSTVKRLISSCPFIGKSTKSTQKFYDSQSEYKRDFPAGKHTWRILIQSGITFFADENEATALVYQPKGTATVILGILKWRRDLLNALPDLKSYAERNGISLVAEMREQDSDGDYGAYADHNGVINLMDEWKYKGVLSSLDDSISLMSVIDAFSGLEALDTNGDGELSYEELGIMVE